MILLAVKDLWRGFDEDPILRGLNFEVRRGQRIGLVGPNGCGKTTLLRLLQGQDQPDRGEIELHASARIGLLEQQHPVSVAEHTVFEEASLGLQPLLDLQRESLETAELLAGEVRDEQRRQLERRYDAIQEAMIQKQAFELDHRVEEVLDGLGFDRASHQQSIGSLSGGQWSRLMLARLLLEAPDLMLLDEPSNHLDMRATAWLEHFLVQNNQTLLVVSHDRFLLDQVVTEMYELFDGRLEHYTGNYSAYWKQRAQRVEVQRRTYEKQADYVSTQETFIRRYQSGQRHAQAKDREKKLERLERVERPREIVMPKMKFQMSHRTGEIVLEVRDISKGFGDPLFKQLSFQVLHGQRLGIFGPNGSGKSTLLKVLLGEQKPDSGTITNGANLCIGYYDQLLSGMADDQVALRAAWPDADSSMTDQAMRSILAQFGLSKEVVERKVSTLSGGQKSRLTLASLAAQRVNVLVLDEPTNHLDLWACEALEQALCNFSGTILFVSHDRYFVNRIAQRMLILGNPERVQLVEGNYDDYCYTLATALRRCEQQSDQKATSSKSRERRSSQAGASQVTANKWRFSYRKVVDLEKEISQIESQVADLEAKLSEESTYSDAQRSRETQASYDQLREDLAVLYEHWEEAMERNQRG